MADAASQVSRGALAAYFYQPEIAEQQFKVPILQCLQVKPMAAQNGAGERYRIVLSDITNYCQCMLATQANHVVHDGKLERGSLVRIKSCNPTSVKGKQYVQPDALFLVCSSDPTDYSRVSAS